MLNVLWPTFIIISIVYAFFTGNTNNINNEIFESTKNAVELSISLLGTICFWNGIMEIATKTSLIEKITRYIQPLINFLFPEIKNKNRINKEISMNIIANVLGLGNASTPIGLRVMKLLQNENYQKNVISNSMAMFIVINTASLQLIPTTVIAIRNSLGSENSTQILLPVWFSTICSAVTAIIVTKLFIVRSK